jgi:hypothetical protein
MTEDLKRRIRRRARYRCEYCQLPQSASRLRHQIDHIIAEQHEGGDDPENLALTCAHEKTQTDCIRGSALWTLIVAAHNRRAGVAEVGGLDLRTPGPTPPGRFLMRHHRARTVPPRAHRN